MVQEQHATRSRTLVFAGRVLALSENVRFVDAASIEVVVVCVVVAVGRVSDAVFALVRIPNGRIVLVHTPIAFVDTRGQKENAPCENAGGREEIAREEDKTPLLG